MSNKIDLNKPSRFVLPLPAGERFRLENGESLAIVRSGKIEVYAVTKGEGSFRQQFLAEISEGSAAFPALDEFETVDTLIYAIEDTEIEIQPFSAVNLDELQRLMREWFAYLVKLPWMTLLADKGDEQVIAWRDGTVLNGKENSLDDLLEEFRDNEEIFSMLLGMRFNSDDIRFTRRVEVRARNQQRMMNNSVANLLGEENTPFSEGISDNRKREDQLENVTFIVQRVALALRMPIDNIKIAPELTRKLDQIRLIRRLMQKGNMQMRLISLEKDWYKKDSGVILGYYGDDKELAAFVPLTPSSYKLITKKNPDGINIDDEVAAKIDKDAFACYGGFPARKLKIFDLLKFIFKQCWFADYRVVIFISFISGLLPLIMPIVTETIFQDIIPNLDYSGLSTVTQVTFIMSFTMASLGIVRSIAVMRITSKIDMATEAALWGRLLTLPTTFFRKFTTGELASRMGGMGVVKGLVSPEFIGGIFGFVFSFWSIFLMCYYSLKLTAAAVAVWLVYCIITAIIYWRVLKMQRKMIDTGNKLSGIIQQIFSGLSKFREHGAEKQAFLLWTKAFGEHWNWSLKLRWQGNYNMIIGSIQPFILSMLMYYIAVYGINEIGPNGEQIQGITYAQFIAFQAAFTAFNGTLNGIIPLVGHYFEIQPHIENFRPILEEEPESVGDKIDAGVLSGAIEVSNLTFGYGENGKDVLHDVSFKVSAGENVAIVGRSGCGKSTLVRLLLGFEKPRKGAIYYDGQDLSELNMPSVRTQMGVVLQNGQLMQGDIFTNIIGTNALTQDDAWQAAAAAGIADDIAMMPMGMQTVISEGSSNISGGQRQRILIARALVTKPSILIFDEATSALDNRTQSIVTNSLNSLHTTRIIVAHRLSTIRQCDKIFVMDAGRIVEQGGFDELVKQGGIFSNLVKRQMA
ncbi:MAG: NHLP bacteriocin export ABC transporter permease/ATPase subunit [Selenomonadaceae bacterium]|nr:NHLP bacteriocin export ABC transporter permease/ATPase subunit [Selenomonadaceae bacterium]